MRHILWMAVVSTVVVGSAGTAVGETQVYDWSDADMPVLVRNDSGLIFIAKDKRPRRVYTWKAANAGDGFDTVYLADLDADSTREVVGAGKPTFVLQSNSDPSWQLEDGCDQTIVADFVADDKLDLLCQNDEILQVFTYDGQMVWKLSLGRHIDHCRAGDYNGDLKADLACKYRGRDSWARIGSNGEVSGQKITSPEISKGGVDLEEAQPSSREVVAGETLFDLDGDGHADERLTADKDALVIGSKARSKAIARVELGAPAKAALVKDIDGDGNKDIVAATDDAIFVIDRDGGSKKKYSASAASYDRKPLAKLNSVYANNFTDKQAAQKVVDDLQGDLSECYADRVERNKFTGVGQLILRVKVDPDAQISAVQQVHSAVRDDKVESCAKKVLKGGDYPPAKKDTTATVNVNMTYTFQDE